MKQSFSNYFKEERRQYARAFCMQRALLAPGHNCCLEDDHLNQPFTVTADTKICRETPESNRSCQLVATRLVKQVLPHVLLTPARSKVSTPRGLILDNDTESRDAWSVSMATPQSEEQQVNLVELVDTANSSTSGDESCSSLSNVAEHSGSSRVEHDDMKGEMISQRFVVKQETQNEYCHRTPLTLVARKLFTKTECDNLSSSHSTSPDLISSSQYTAHDSQEAMKNKEAISIPVNSSPTCSQDMFDPAAQCDITPSCVMSSTPVSSAFVGRHERDETITETHVTNDLVGDHTENKNSDTSYHKLDSEVHSHTGDVKLCGSSSSPNYKPDTSEQKCKGLYSNISCNEDVSYHDNSDLMDELFANNLTNLTQVATEQLLEEEQQRLTHSKPIVDHTDSGCGDDVTDNDVLDHVISKDETVTPITAANGFCHFTVADAVKPSSSTSNTGSQRKSCKSFKAPRMAKEVAEDEKNKLVEQYCKKFPSLVVNDNIRRTGCGDDGVTNNLPMSTGQLISCGFTSAGSGKKLTVSAAALQHAVRLVEDCTGDLISGVSDTGSHGNCTSNKAADHVEEQMVDISTDTTKKLPFGTSTKVVEETKEPSPSCLLEKEVGESSECGKEERSCDTSKGSHDPVENYGLENIDMEQFSAFTQMPGYVRAAVRSGDDIVEDDCRASVQQISEDTWTPAEQSCITPVEKEAVSSYITPGGSFNPCHTGRSVYNVTPCQQPTDEHDDEELKKMFNTQLVKQFLDFSSSNEDDDRMTASVKVTDQLQKFNDNSASPTHNDETSPCARSCDTDSHAHNKTCSVTEKNASCHNDDHIHSGSHDNSPTHHDNRKPSVSMHKGAVLGLSTASGKSVTISSNAISSVKKLLDDKCNDVNRTFAGQQLCTANGDVVNICDRSLRAVKQLFIDDKDDDAAVAIGNHASDDNNKSTIGDMTTAVQDNDIEVMSLNEPSHDTAVVLSIQRSCDPTPDSTVAGEASPANKTNNYTERITRGMKRRRDPLYTTPEAVLSDRVHPKRMCFTPMVTNSNSIVKTPLSSGKQTPKFMTPFKAHRMSSTPQERSVQPVWRRGWKKLGMSSTSISFHCSNNISSSNNNKSVNDSGIGSSLPDHHPVTTTVEEQEGIDKQFEVTDTQMESFLATQDSVSPIVNHHDNSGVVRPQRGTLSMMRSTSVQRVSLTGMTGCVRPGRYSRHQLISLGVHPTVLDVTAATAVNFQFDVHHYFSQSVLQKGAVTVGDGVVLKLGPHNDHVTMDQLQKAFISSPGVESKLISMEWFSNHYRWIVWKLASLEVSFPHSFADKWLTPHWLLLHMKYRYDREIDLAHRSCIKKILERDDNSSKSMVLIITEICSYDDVIDGSCDQTDVKDTSCPTVKMSDGWYSVGVVMDTPLKHILSTNQITVGYKLYISGAKLLGSCDPCPPLECPDSVMLKINANSTRRAHWNAKLGFQPCPVPFPVPMSSLYPDGGLVGCVHVTIVRTYPLQHMERTTDGSCVFRNQRKEEMVAKEYDTRRQQCLEDISLQVHEEFEKELNQKSGRQCYRRRRSMSNTQISKLTDGQKIDEALNSVPDPVEFEQHLTVTQKALLDSYRHGVLEQQRRELEQRMEMAVKECEDKLPPLRNVVPLLKVRVVGHPSRLNEWTDNIRSCILTVWRPTDDVMCLLQEGVSVKLYHVMASSPHHHSSDYIQLATNRGTRFEQLSKVDEDLLQSLYQPRKVTPLAHMASSNHSIDYGQVDIVGIIITVLSSHITTANGREKSVDKVYITDEDDNIIVVKVWHGIESLISKDCLSAGQVVCFINLSYKAWLDDDGIPTCSASDQSIITIKPQDDYLKPTFQSLQKFIKSNSTVLKNLEERIAQLH